MRQFTLALFVLTLATLACRKATPCEVNPAVCVTPSPAPSATEPTPSPLPPNPTPAATGTEAAETATVKAAVVNIRFTPGGVGVVGQITAGSEVILLEPCKDEWCRIQVDIGKELIVGWVFQGCLSVALDEQKCEAR